MILARTALLLASLVLLIGISGFALSVGTAYGWHAPGHGAITPADRDAGSSIFPTDGVKVSPGNEDGVRTTPGGEDGVKTSPGDEDGVGVSPGEEDGVQVGQRGIGLMNPLQVDSLEKLLEKVLEAVVRIGTIVLILALIWIGFLFVAARGSEEKIRDARRALFWTIIGGLLLLGAEALSLVIQQTATTVGGS